MTFITEQGVVDKDSEASHNSTLKTPFERCAPPGLFDISRNPHHESTTKSVGYTVQNQAHKVRSPPTVPSTGAVQYDRSTSTRGAESVGPPLRVGKHSVDKFRRTAHHIFYNRIDLGALTGRRLAEEK